MLSLKPTTLLSLLPAFITFSAVTATPLKARASSPSINAIFFSDTNCTTTVPPTIYTRPISGDHQGCYSYPSELWQSVLIDSIDAQFIGTNSALEIGNSGAGAACDFTDSVRFSVATGELVGKCLFVGIERGQGQPSVGGNEYRLTTLEG